MTATTSATCVNSPSSTAGVACPEPVASPYIVYPVDGTSVDETDNIEKLFDILNVSRDSPFFTSSSQYLGKLFWYAILKPDQVSALEANLNVRALLTTNGTIILTCS